MTAPQARLRAESEPLVEMIQYKGDSECHPGIGTEDELCSFEKLNPIAPCAPGNPPSKFCYVECDENGKPDGCAVRAELRAKRAETRAWASRNESA